jgi:hypothetical protein
MIMRRLLILSLVAVLGGWSLSTRNIARVSAQPLNPVAFVAPQEAKIMREFHGIKLGLKTDAVHTALGKPESADASREEYKLSDEDMITVHYDNGAVRAIQMYFTSTKNVPPWKQVVGNAEIKENENGSKQARVTVNAEGFWVSMYQNKTGTVTTITISR